MLSKSPAWIHQREKELFSLTDELLEHIYLLPLEDLLIEASGVNCFNSMSARLHHVLYSSYKQRYETFHLPVQLEVPKH